MQVINRKWLLSRTLLIIFILLTPLIQVFLIKGADRYKIGPFFEEKYSYIGKKIFNEKGPLDFLFLGPSQTRDSVNARLIQDSLKVSAENFAHNDLGYDLDYLIFKDAVEQRGVKIAFIGLGGRKVQNQFHRVSRFLWNPIEEPSNALYAEQILESLPFIAKSIFSPYDFIDNGQWDQTNGSTIVAAGFSENSSRPDKNIPFIRVKPNPKFHNLSELSLSSDKILSTGTFNEFQKTYLKKMINLAQKNNVKLYFLSFPMLATDSDLTKVDLLMTSELPYLGIPENILFSTDSRDEMKKYFWNPLHTNANGNLHYTLSILPALWEIHESSLR